MKIKPHKNYYICNQPNINSHSLMMKQLIACCGLDCESCDARIATVRDDNELREKTAQLWSELNNIPEITADTINCMGLSCGWGENDVLQRYVRNSQMRKRKRI